ncbi:hypothetical protein SKAU_G00290600 [Synaphobranchus kaupii]|uniref:SEA domain-containing protein n=1 Tax=Synaphobranchus kaupii TaxID=118154 RepID=A0A9Q1ETP9_SYNKA|nr:hypothetical protein SKAU_G00290600 [Synaphobranchus kaupii]
MLHELIICCSVAAIFTPAALAESTATVPSSTTMDSRLVMTSGTPIMSTSQTIKTATPQNETTTAIVTPTASTSSPPNSQTSGTPEGGTSSPTPPAVPSPSSSTPTEPGNNSTIAPNTTLTPEKPAGFCFSSPCPFDSTCEELFMSFRCLCLPGSFLANGSCVPAKVFPGQLRLTSITFKEEMTNTSSQIFLETEKEIIESLKGVLGNQPGYVRSTVLELRQGSVVASVQNVFLRTSSVNQAAVTTVIQACKNCGLLEGAQFNETDLCSRDPGPCDTMTTNCNYSGDGFSTCTCKPGYLSTHFSNKSCAACPSGEKAEEGKCVACPFGYAGFNCDDSTLLAVVVISCVLGGVLLIVLLAFIIYCCCMARVQEQPSYSSPYPAEDFRNTWSNKEIIPIPRASLNWDSQIELTENRNAARKSNGNGMSYDISRGDLKTFTGKNPSRAGMTTRPE